MERFKVVLKRMFCLPPLPTVLAALFGFGLVTAVFAFNIQNPVVQYASYLASAYALAVTVAGFVHILAAAGGVRKFVSEHPLMKRFRSTPLGDKLITDVRFRSRAALCAGLTMNLGYIALKLTSGIVYRSEWFVVLAVYYILLAAMRFLLVIRSDTPNAAAEWRRYRLCGIMLLFMNQALVGIVVFMVHQNKGFEYPGLLIYAMAAYSFYAVAVSVINIVKTRRQKSPILSAAKAINFVAAMVSILSLETAMLAQFGGDDAVFRRAMTGATGGAVCAVVIAMAVYMILRANKNLKKIEINNSQT